MARGRFHKGDKIVLTQPMFVPRATGLVPTGTTGTILHSGRWGAQVALDIPDRDGNPTLLAGILPYPTNEVERRP